ncbi:methyl-accepting chemotaxis protein [Haliangium ochraceum]|uniref:Methyl-accepting chemotaxis sensory transducer n=1 Tax=Haliangium ochraceum (strain DSM 14365 / JCM 11303 / SMP-2) TaxID=502025 RepID=D0LT78_HALO1|nr:methyl-accepting chemotaxis protein [Haliangium ochraceum]ACY19214.1 methyl-accepting chemotaxis sensory transducer [Haliangium ochraceum DSM 14365]
MMRSLLQRLRQTKDERAQAARLLYASALGTLLGTLIFGTLFTLRGPRELGIFVLLMAIPLGGSLGVLRQTGSVRNAAQVYLFSVWLIVSGTALVLGGVESPAFPAYFLLILGATFLVGRRAGAAWTGAVMISVLAIEFAQGIGAPRLPVPDDRLRFFSLLALLVVVPLVGLFSLLYDDAKSTAMGELRGANRRIAQMIAQLEEASDRLVSSSERFLGTQVHSGLVGRMMTKTRSGHLALEESRASIARMIEQYQQISARVQRLFEHSQRIVELVYTIDRISDRLDMMALNVGIEASRSGDSGKQFGVLAGDMRVLAERVLAETRQIKGALHSVHEQVREVLEVSASGRVMTEESARKLTTMARTFSEIYLLVEETESATGEITEDTLAQLDAVRQLVSAAARAVVATPSRSE